MLALGVLLATGSAQADTLADALARVHASNPTIAAARAGLDATEAGIGIARADGMPKLRIDGEYDRFVRRSVNAFTAPDRAFSAQATLDVPLFAGGRVRNAVSAAKAGAQAGRADLAATEAEVFVDAVGAYMDVIRDTAIVGLDSNNVAVLEAELRAARKRFEVGDITRTDVAQSDARLALARGKLRTAEAELDASRQDYQRIIGKLPEALEPPPPLAGLPATSEAAVDIALANNPDLEAAKRQAKAADYDVRAALAERMPKVSAFGTGNYNDYFGTLGGAGNPIGLAQTETTATVGLRGSLPIFQGGGTGARIAQARARRTQSGDKVELAERAVVADAQTAFSRYAAAKAVIESSRTAVSANELAVRGVRAEQTVGTRDVLDVLNAEQELLDARVNLVTAERDAYVRGFALLAAMGQALLPVEANAATTVETRPWRRRSPTQWTPESTTKEYYYIVPQYVSLH